VTGDAGTGSQTFTYDALNRVTGASGLGTAFTYTYDRNGNRKTKSDGTTTLTSTYDRTDQLRTIGNGVLADATFTYNAYGDLTAKVERPTGGAWQTTTHTYDLAGKLTGLDGPAAGTGDAATFTFDALGRFRTRVLSGSTDTYSYLGTTETVLRIANSGGTTTDSLVDSAGTRLGVAAGSTLNWFLPDPHGNVAAALSSDEATVVNALRYDPWGDLAATGSGGGTAVGASYWKYQGRLDVAPAGSDAGALYDMSARFYSPSLGAFTQLDSVMGSAQDPRSMNRFLYAHANPATLIDPTGHVAMQACSAMADYCPGASGSLYKPKVNKKARSDRQYVYRSAARPTQKGGRPVGSRPSPARTVGSLSATPWNPGLVADLMFPYGTFEEAKYDRYVGQVERMPKPYASDAEAITAMLGFYLSMVSAAAMPGTTLLTAGLDPGPACGDGGETMCQAASLALALATRRVKPALGAIGGRVNPTLVSSELGVLARAEQSGLNLVGRPNGIFRSCAAHSFRADTAVATPTGTVAISALAVGDTVLARNEATGRVEPRAVTAVHVNHDEVTGKVVIDGETIETTPNHPFFTIERGWVGADDLRAGDRVASTNGHAGTVEAATWTGGPSVMYDLTVDVAHTYFVGQGEWLVHNCGVRPGPKLWPEGPHNQMIQRRIDELVGQGYQHTHGGNLVEEYIRTPGGLRTARRPDITMRAPDGVLYRENVGLTDAAGNPIRRELEALRDLEDQLGMRPAFTPYYR
jgi:RHS repeat-associated protein